MGLEINEGPAKRSRKVAPTASAQILADANRIEYATDSAGRAIGVRKLNALDLFELTLSLGNEVSTNQSALMQALAAASVCSVDGDLVARPSTILQLKALIKRLDFHGMAAAQEALARFTDESAEGIDSAKN